VGAVLRRKQVSVPCLVHGFSGSSEQARALWDTGCFLGVGGVITYERANKTRNAIRDIPLEALVLETDAPDMPPAGVAKGANSPVYLPRIFQSLCDLRREPAQQVAEQLLVNVSTLYGWKVPADIRPGA
jgi:TatD DNase family protein